MTSGTTIERARLDAGQPLPALTVSRVGGSSILLQAELAGGIGVIPIYRGSWCPYCMAQLAGFARAADVLSDCRLEVVALSVDDEKTSGELVDKRQITLPVGPSADAGTSGFVLAPNGGVLAAVCSTGATDRLVAEDVVSFVRDLRAGR